MRFQQKYNEGDTVKGHLLVKNIGNVMFGKQKKRVALFRCLNCGEIKEQQVSAVSRKRNNHCGCLGDERHGGTNTRLYNIWNGIGNRCYNPKTPEYKWYGAKGIIMCSEWKRFSVFRKWAEGNGYKENLTIDRKDNGLGYSPQNCQWETVAYQNRHQTTTKLNWEMVNDIRRLKGSTTNRDLAKLFWVSPRQISDIIANKRWKVETLNTI